MNIKKNYKIAAISDVHEQYHNLIIPEVDILISAGDYSYQGKFHIVKDFHKWLNKQPARYIISVQGNHEVLVEENFEIAKSIAKEVCPNIYFLQHETIEIEGIKIFGSAWTPFFCNWAWNGARTLSEQMIRNKPLLKDLWNDIQPKTEIVVTHGPAYGILDEIPHGLDTKVGCYDLFSKLQEIKPKIHICGHIHHSYGYKYFNDIQHYNVAICNESYRPINPVTIIEYEKSN